MVLVSCLVNTATEAAAGVCANRHEQVCTVVIFCLTWIYVSGMLLHY